MSEKTRILHRTDYLKNKNNQIDIFRLATILSLRLRAKRCLCDCLRLVGANSYILHRRKKQHTAEMEEDQLRRSGNAEL